ncbi:hypothetical protein DU484_06040 [Haloplanus rubicundus]|uniref:Uncharacterized protein n=1 Tax=Haloplanus rubicundus TaxID=1547898 RepID=A0A345EB94_9EURY|nr:hypothetical protein DU484_06040 [Haloplanus rubicundus]
MVQLSTLFVATRHVGDVDGTDLSVVAGVQSAPYPGTEFDRAVGSPLVVWRGTAGDNRRPRWQPVGHEGVHGTTRTPRRTIPTTDQSLSGPSETP